METQEAKTFAGFVAERFGGVLMSGGHDPDGKACALEAYSQFREEDWTDDPDELGMPDVRPLNDAWGWPDDATRAEHLIPVVEALAGWSDWPAERRQAWTERIVLRTGREVLPITLDAAGLSEHAQACREADILEALQKAARAAEAASSAAWAARAAAWAAWAAWAAEAARAARAAAWAAEAARAAARAAASAAASAAAAAAAVAEEDVLILACRIWAEEAKATA